MFWSGGKLELEIEKIVAPFDPAQIDCASYTLKIGRQVYISPESGSKKGRKVVDLHRAETFEIPSGQFALIITDEILTIPKNVLAFINTKSRLKLRGLVNISGFHVDPGYHGKIIFSVYNAGPTSIILRQGDDFGLIWFANTDDRYGDKIKSGTGFVNLSSDMITQVPGNNLSLEVLRKRLDNMQRNFFVTIALLVFPVLGALSVAIFQVIFTKWFG